MLRRNLAIVGLLLLTGSIMIAYKLSDGIWAAARDRGDSFLAGGPCRHPLSDVHMARRTISIRESQALTVILSNDSQETCEVTIELSAPNFVVSPAEPRRTLNLPATERAIKAVWVIAPKESGVFELAISAGLDSRIIGIAVTDVFGLSARQAQLLMYLGGLLGPMFTFPWWYEKWQEKRGRVTTRKSKKR
jgi:hypothetical protein